MKTSLLSIFLLLFSSLIFGQEDTVTVIAIKANLRGTPNSQGIVVTTVNSGEKFELITRKGAWFLVQTPKYVGWIHGNAIRLETVEDLLKEVDEVLGRKPKQPNTNTPQKTTKPVTKGEPLFQKEYVGDYGNPTVHIKNDAGLTVTLIFGGVKYILLAGETKSITIEPGNYEYHASAPGVYPTSGVENYEAGYRYSWRFYITQY